MDQAQQLRMIKESKQPERPLARVITITSGKGGVGKSNTAINLAIHMRQLGKRVLILDADLGMANIEIMFGAIPKYNLYDLIYQGKSIQEIITPGPMDIGFISGGSGISALSSLGKDALGTIVSKLGELDQLADVIIIDTGAGIADSVLEFLVAGEDVVLVTTPEPTSITDSYSLLKVLFKHPSFDPEITKVRMVANKVEREQDGEALYGKLGAVVSRYLGLSIGFLGSVPQDQALTRAVMQQVPVSLQNPGAKSAKAYEGIARKLLGEEPSKGPSRGIAAFMGRLLGRRAQ